MRRADHLSVKYFAAVMATLFSVGCVDDQPVFLADYEAFDLLISNAQIIDGLGGEPVTADLLIADGVIVFVGDAEFDPDEIENRVERHIDAAGRVLTPGFIDLHSHGDPLQTPTFENFLAMGVTTISLGQDGSSPDVGSLREWLQEVSDAGIGPNLAMFVGHGTLRNQSGIGRDTDPDPADTARMLDLLNRELAFTFGLSTGLEYNPGLNADSAELQAMAKVVGARDRLIMSHIRNEDDDQIESSLAELLEQGRHARVHVAHLKSVYGQGANRADEILQLLAEAREQGIRVTADVYPYNASYATIALVFPPWAKTDDDFALAKRERREELEEFLRNRIERRNGPDATLFGTAPYTGKTLAQLSHEQERAFEDILIDEIGPTGASGAYFVMNAGLQSRLLADPFVGVCSDGSPTGFHPRGHGTYAKIIQRFVVEEGLLTLPEAIRKMTSFPASVLGIPDRGIVAEGMVADLLIFDPAAIKDNATYPNPHQLAAGFDIVIINGRIARQNGELSESLSGEVLLPPFRIGMPDE
jgi:N-acyl-D-amino-acid deacylase